MPLLLLLLLGLGAAAASRPGNESRPGTDPKAAGRAKAARAAGNAARAASAGTTAKRERDARAAAYSQGQRRAGQAARAASAAAVRRGPSLDPSEVVSVLQTLDPVRIRSYALRHRVTHPGHFGDLMHAADDLQGTARKPASPLGDVSTGLGTSRELLDFMQARRDASDAAYRRDAQKAYEVGAPAAVALASEINPVAGAVLGLGLALVGSPEEQYAAYEAGQQANRQRAAERKRLAELLPGSDPLYDEWKRLAIPPQPGIENHRGSLAYRIGWQGWLEGRRTDWGD